MFQISIYYYYYLTIFLLEAPLIKCGQKPLSSEMPKILNVLLLCSSVCGLAIQVQRCN